MIDPRWSPRLRWPLVTAVVGLGFSFPLVAGQWNAPVALVGLGATVLGRLVRRRSELPGDGLLGWRVANASVLVLCMIGAAVRIPLLLVAVCLVSWLQVHRAWTGRQAQDDRISLLLALLMALLGSILTTSPVLAPLLLAFVLMMPLALVLCQLGRAGGGGVAEGRPGGLGLLLAMGPVGLALTLTLFVVVPRVRGGRLAYTDEARSMVGFGDEVRLGELGEIKDNPAIVLRARITGAGGQAVQGPFYFRGATLDAFDGRTWTRLEGRASSGRQAAPEGAERINQEILLEPIDESVLFGIPILERVAATDTRARVDEGGTWEGNHDGRRIAYTAVSAVLPRDQVGAHSRSLSVRQAKAPMERLALFEGRWTDLPDTLDPRVQELAEQLSLDQRLDASPYQRAVAVETWLESSYSYTLVPEPAHAHQPLGSFLFDTRRGHCEYFATALAVLLRSQGIPARVVNGFYGGEWNELGGYWVLRQRDAHSWVEAWMGEPGWVTLDATPAVPAEPRSAGLASQALDWAANRWHRTVLSYDLDAQLALGVGMAEMLQDATGPLGPRLPAWAPLGGLALLALGLAVALRRLLRSLLGPRQRRRGSGASRVERLYHRGRRLVGRRGWEIPPELPPLEAARWLRLRAGPAAQGLEDLAWLMYRVRYRGEAEGLLVPGARHALSELRALPRRRRAGTGDPLERSNDVRAR